MLYGIDSVARQMPRQPQGQDPTVLTVRKARACLQEVKHRHRLMVAKEATRRALILHLWQEVEEGSRRESSASLRKALYVSKHTFLPPLEPQGSCRFTFQASAKHAQYVKKI